MARRRSLALMVAASAAVVATFALWVELQLGGADVSDAVDSVGPVVVAAAALPFALARALREMDARTRIGWLCLVASLVSYAVSSADYSWYEVVLHVPSPVVSLSDPTDLGGAAFCIPAVLLLGGRAVPTSRLRLVLDSGIAVGAILLVSWLTVLHVVYAQANAATLAGQVGIAYPLLDVLSTAVVIGALANVDRLSPSLAVVGVAVVTYAISDSVYGFLSSLGVYDNGATLADAGYPAGFLLVAIASMLPGADPDLPPRRLLHRWQVVMPYLPLVASTPVVVATIAVRGRLDAFSQIVLGAVLAFIVVRQLVVVVESRALAGALAAAVERWKQASAERELLIQRAPVGICRLDAEARVLDVNLAVQRMLRLSREELVGRPFATLLHADDRRRGLPFSEGAATGWIDHLETECRLVRGDGVGMWCSLVVSPVHASPRPAADLIAIVEDITQRRREAAHAANIQRQLLPQSAPLVPGYELAAACLPARDVSGDLYDWVLLPDGSLDVAVADVMGKGVGAALIMAVLHTALHTSPPSLGLADRVRLMADSIAVGITEAGLFVTLFYARLDPLSGRLRYVDAGHGYCGIRRRRGEVSLLPVRSLPVGVQREESFAEGEARLEPGDSLVVYSDGLVETEAGTRPLTDLARELGGAGDAAEMVGRLLGTIGGQLADDVTVTVLRRRPDAEPLADDRLAVSSGLGRFARTG